MKNREKNKAVPYKIITGGKVVQSGVLSSKSDAITLKKALTSKKSKTFIVAV